MLSVGILITVWLIVVVLFLIGWARIHAVYRAVDGIDEEQYVNGLDERSVREAA